MLATGSLAATRSTLFCLFSCLLAASCAQQSLAVWVPSDYQVNYDQGYESGYSSGYDYGFDTGYDRGESEGGEEGYDDGYELGWQTSYQPSYDKAYSRNLPKGYRIGKRDGFESGFGEGFRFAEYWYGEGGRTNDQSGVILTYSLPIFDPNIRNDNPGGFYGATISISGGGVVSLDPAIDFYNMGHSAGFRIGKEIGDKEGYTVGFDIGYETQHIVGLGEGKTEGRREGIIDGRADGFSAGKIAGYDDFYPTGRSAGIDFFLQGGDLSQVNWSSYAVMSAPEPSACLLSLMALPALLTRRR